MAIAVERLAACDVGQADNLAKVARLYNRQQTQTHPSDEPRAVRRIALNILVEPTSSARGRRRAHGPQPLPKATLRRHHTVLAAHELRITTRARASSKCGHVFCTTGDEDQSS